MKVLIACEYSGVVRDAFLSLGHDAISCDLMPSESPGPHYQGNVLNIIGDGFDLMIAHPPCTYLCSSGLHWNKRRPERTSLTEESLSFVNKLLNAPINKIALENPVGCISTRIRPYDQVIQPYEFGHDASKKTCLWLKNLPKLVPTSYYPPRVINGKTDGAIKRILVRTDWGRQKIGGKKEVKLMKELPKQWPYNGVV